MNYFLLIFSLFIYSFSFAQNKKTLLSEIALYKQNQIKKSTFSTTSDSLIQTLTDYFYRDDYQIHSKTDTEVIFYKRIRCTGEKQFFSENTDNNIRGMNRRFYVTILLMKDNKQIIPKITSEISDNYPSKYEYNQAVLSGGTYSFRVDDRRRLCNSNGYRFNFNSLDVKKYLYVYFYGNMIPFSEELITKIETYNARQEKESKKIIAGIDY